MMDEVPILVPRTLRNNLVGRQRPLIEPSIDDLLKPGNTFERPNVKG